MILTSNRDILPRKGSGGWKVGRLETAIWLPWKMHGWKMNERKNHLNKTGSQKERICQNNASPFSWAFAVQIQGALKKKAANAFERAKGSSFWRTTWWCWMLMTFKTTPAWVGYQHFFQRGGHVIHWRRCTGLQPLAVWRGSNHGLQQAQNRGVQFWNLLFHFRFYVKLQGFNW